MVIFCFVFESSSAKPICLQPQKQMEFCAFIFPLTSCIINTTSYSHNPTDKVLMIHKVRVNSV